MTIAAINAVIDNYSDYVLSLQIMTKTAIVAGTVNLLVIF